MFGLAVTIRSAVHKVDYPRQLNHFLSELKQLVMVVVAALFGLAIGNGLLGGLSIAAWLFALVTLFVVRPVAALIAVPHFQIFEDLCVPLAREMVAEQEQWCECGERSG